MDGDGRTKLGRRALLAAGAAGVAAAAVQAVGPARVLAGGDHQPVVQGETNSGTLTTVVATAGNDGVRGQSDVGDGLVGQSNGGARSGAYAFNTHPDGFGVYGVNIPSGAVGVLGARDHGVKGAASAAVGVRGESNTNFGVVGRSGGKDKAGVLGEATNADGFGVQGRNTASHTYGYLGGEENGVYGASAVANKAAVKGEHAGPAGAAVYGENTAGNASGGLGIGNTGVLGQAPTDLDHAGLTVIGRAMFLTRSGLLTIAKNKSSVSNPVPLAGGQTPSMVLATLQTNRPGIYIQAAVANPATNMITIYLNKKVTAATKVAVFILN